MAQLSYPADLKYASTDEWVKVEGDEALIGVSDYAQNALSDVVFVELPKVGETYSKGANFGTVESVKAASDMHMPISGTVTAINKGLEDDPEKVNTAPYESWFVRIKIANKAELESLMDAAAYESFCATRD